MISRLLRSSVAFVLGFAAVCTCVSLATPQIRVRRVSDKIEMFRLHSDRFDTVLLGSSRTGRQVVPAVFDQAMAAAGVPTRTFNLGIEGLRPPEDSMVLDKALHGRAKPMKFLVVECNALQSLMIEEDKWTTRAIFTHDAKRLGVYWRHIWARQLDDPWQFEDWLKRTWDYSREFIVHLRHFVWNQARVSEGAARLSAAITGIPRNEKRQPPPEDGFYLKETELTPLAGKELAKYRKNLDAQKSAAPVPVFEDTASQAELREKKAWADRLGARLVLVSPPFLKQHNFTPKDLDGVIFLDFSDPNQFPELFAPEGRRDYGHLNDATSRRYSQILAERLATALQSPP